MKQNINLAVSVTVQIIAATSSSKTIYILIHLKCMVFLLSCIYLIHLFADHDM